MSPVLALQIISVIAGVVCLWIALFLYEDEEKRVQSVLEDAWLRVRSGHEHSLAWHLVLIRVSAYSASTIIDFIFGKNWKRAFWICLCLSIASTCIIAGMCVLAEQAGILWAMVLFLAAAAGFDEVRKLRNWQHSVMDAVLYGYLLLPLLELVFASPSGDGFLADLGYYYKNVLLMHLSVTLAALVGLLFLQITNLMLEFAKETHSGAKVLIWSAINCAAATGLIIAEYDLEGRSFGEGIATDAMMYVSFLCLGTAVTSFAISSLFYLIITMLLVHKLLWVVFERPIYYLQGLGLVRRKILLTTLGSILVASAIPGADKVLEAVVKALH